jgi:hypothetical protein
MTIENQNRRAPERHEPHEQNQQAASHQMLHEVHADRETKRSAGKPEHDAQHLHFDHSIYGGREHQNKAEKSLPAEDKAARQANANKMLDANTSHEDKVKLAAHMYEHGQKSFTDKDGHKFDINESKAGDKKQVGVFAHDAQGHSQTALRGNVEKDGSVSQQKDRNGNRVDYEGTWAKSNDGGGLRKAPDVEKGVDQKDGSNFERHKNANGETSETHTGDKPNQNYTKIDDGQGRSLARYKDGTGYARTQQQDGSYHETHFGPNPSDHYTKSGDGKGNAVETRTEGKNSIEKHTFEKNPGANFTREQHADKSQTITDAKGDKTVISPDGNTSTYTGVDGKSITREKTQYGFKETYTGPNQSDNYKVDFKTDGTGNTMTTRDDGDGHKIESRTYPDANNNYKKETFADNSTRTTDAKGNVTSVSPDGKTTRT